MKVRVILVCTLLMLAAVPSFALPLCGHCTEWNDCENGTGDVERCKWDIFGHCGTDTGRCSVPSATQSTVLTDWKVASIDTSCPALDSRTVTAPAAVAAVPAATPAPQPSELK